MSEQRTPAPKPAQVDALVREYAAAQAAVTASKETLDACQEAAGRLKAQLIDLVRTHGVKHAEKSLRLEGLHSKATVTIGTRTTTDAAAIDSFRAYLDKQEIAGLSGQFFREHVSYSLVEAPREVLSRLDLATRIRNRIAGLLALCFRVETNSPTLKVELAETEKPQK